MTFASVLFEVEELYIQKCAVLKKMKAGNKIRSRATCIWKAGSVEWTPDAYQCICP